MGDDNSIQLRIGQQFVYSAGQLQPVGVGNAGGANLKNLLCRKLRRRLGVTPIAGTT